MKKAYFLVLILALTTLTSCGSKSTKKRSLDQTLYKYAALIRFSEYDAAIGFLKPDVPEIQPSSFEIEHLKQFRVSNYDEFPIQPGASPNVILQTVKLKLYNIHNNREREVIDQQSWEYDENSKRWFLTSGIPKLK